MLKFIEWWLVLFRLIDERSVLNENYDIYGGVCIVFMVDIFLFVREFFFFYRSEIK